MMNWEQIHHLIFKIYLSDFRKNTDLSPDRVNQSVGGRSRLRQAILFIEALHLRRWQALQMALTTLISQKFLSKIPPFQPVQFVTTLGILSALLLNTSTSTLAQPASDVSSEEPNQQLTVEQQSGTCPASVGLWTVLLPSEGAADHTVVADTKAIASNGKISSSGNTFVEYEAPLQEAYASCVGQASSPDLHSYSFEFRNGKVYFRVNLDWVPGYTKIVSKTVASGRPFVHWQASE
ncbi:hypothetical protein NDI44_10050 [Trichocoleus sp. DQ-A3]|uniref:hypothetical protein n=1 Tax=Cyanophyceae TaxID=3028117 RepID=UPI001686B75D|nr:hypothetical protein [Coleofasciculus sp. FACHB-125]MBD1903099.1 hypothetical protein [Coleofasciculus sp. FACHB-125]